MAVKIIQHAKHMYSIATSDKASTNPKKFLVVESQVLSNHRKIIQDMRSVEASSEKDVIKRIRNNEYDSFNKITDRL